VTGLDRGVRLWRRSSALRAAAVVIALLAVFLVPRLVALRGVSRVSHLAFMDMFYHLARLDVMVKRGRLSPAQLEDPYVVRHPELIRPYRVVRWPLGVYYAALPWYAAFGPASIWTVQLTNLPFTVLLALGVVGLGRAMGGWRIGIWGAALTLLCPALVAHSWYFSLDYPLVAMVVIGLYLLWRARCFRSLRGSLALALWSGLGLTIKTTYALYLAVPAAAALACGLARPGERGRRALLGHAALAAGLALLLGFLLNGWSPTQIWRELHTHVAGTLDRGDLPYDLIEPWTLRWAGAMAIFAAASFPWPLLLLALPGLGLAHRPRRELPGRWLWLAFFWGTYVVLTLVANKMERYLQPVYPLLCLLSVWSVLALVPRRWQTTALLWLVTAYAAVLYVAHEHPTPWYPDARSATRGRYMLELAMPGRTVLDGLRRHPDHPRCDLGPLLDAGLEMDRGSRRPLAVAIQWPRSARPLPLMTHDLYLPLLQRARGRFVFFHDLENQDPINPGLLEAPSLLVLHPPELDPGERYPRLRRRGRRELSLRCGGEPIPARLTLYRGQTAN